MTRPQEAGNERPADDCTELRASVDTLCADAHEAKAAHDAVLEQIRALRRDLVAAQHKQTEVREAADPALRAAEKARARQAYEQARLQAETEAEVSDATATWARALDHINRSGRQAERDAATAKTTVVALEEELREADREEQKQRFRAEQAEAACLDARVRLASCEEGTVSAPDEAEGTVSAPDEAEGTVSAPHAGTGGHAIAVSETQSGGPLVIESMVSGDRMTLTLAAAEVAERTGLSPAEAQLQLQELVDAVVSVASEDGFLLFDPDHPFWAQLSFEEARDVIAALARLGFLFEPAEGWHAGRAPAPSDLSMALAYAGLDARNMRDLPSTEDLLGLPRSIAVDARGFLATRAPELTVDSVVRVLDRRAEPLEPLWNEWGQVRPILLSDLQTLRSAPR